MKLFFKQLLEIAQSLINGKADKKQKWLTYGTLVFGLLISLIFGSISSIVLMCIVALIGELTYCFVPINYVNWQIYTFKYPDFKEFKNDFKNYLKFPRHPFNLWNFAYVLIAIVAFIVLKLIFLIF